MINEKEPLVKRFITLPKYLDLVLLNCVSYVARIIEGDFMLKIL